MRGAWIGTAPIATTCEQVAFMYHCVACDVVGRSEAEGEARCWLCGGSEVEHYRQLLRDQRSLSGGVWTTLPEPVERLVERSR